MCTLLYCEKQELNDEEIERLLNESDFDFSGDDDDDEYLPPEVQNLQQLEDPDEEEEEEPFEEHTEEVVQSSSRLFWRTKEVSCRGPDIADDELVSHGTSEINVLYSFFEYLGQDFWDLVAEQTNLYSAQKRDLRSVNTNFIEMIRFSGVLLMMGTLKYPQGKLYWNRDLCVLIIREAITRQRFYELRNFIHFSAPVDSCKRWCKVQKRKIDVNQPAVVKNYNSCMGGIDLCDRLISYYRSAMRTKKWTVRAFCHFVDLVAENSWIMYTRCCKKENIQTKDKLGLLQYRLNLGKAMMKYDGGRCDPDFISSGTISRPRRDCSSTGMPSPSSTESETYAGPPAKKNRPVISQPIPEVRLDNVGHLPRYVEAKFASKCRHPTCTSRCRTMCVKCNMYLCVLKNNCFESYHTNKNFGPC